jgi:hypothetical protein
LSQASVGDTNELWSGAPKDGAGDDQVVVFSSWNDFSEAQSAFDDERLTKLSPFIAT